MLVNMFAQMWFVISDGPWKMNDFVFLLDIMAKESIR